MFVSHKYLTYKAFLFGLSFGTYNGPERNWIQCLCYFMEDKERVRTMVFV